MKIPATLLICAITFVLLAEGCATNSENEDHYDSAPQTPIDFNQLLRKDERVKKFAVEYAFTPPVPTEKQKVVVFAFRLSGLPPQMPKVLPPDYQIVADYPAGKVESVERVTPAQLNLTLTNGQSLGKVQIPQKLMVKTYEENEAMDKEFHSIYAASIDAYLANRPLSPSACRRVLELLPIFAQALLVPLLHHTSPDFFAFIDNCAR